MKHIGILNFPGHMNQGANLTAYALQHSLQAMGHKAVNLHLRCNYVITKNALYTDFADKNILMTDKDSWGEYTMQQYNDDFDTFIVGSDQVWRHIDGETMFAWKTALEQCFYLGFAEPGKRRIAIAASYGRSDYSAPDSVRERSAEELRRFAAISVREKSAINLVKQIANVDAVQVIDPVFYLSADDWNKFAAPYRSENSKSFIAYNSFFSNEAIEKMEMEINGGDKFTPLLAGNTAEWLANIRDARFVISDSYHVCCFCLIYGTPFASLTRQNQGKARFVELAEYFGISQERIIDTTETQDLTQAIKSIMELPFNREAIHQKIAEGKAISYNWLKAALDAPIPEWSGSPYHKATIAERRKEKRANTQWQRRKHYITRYLAYKILYFTCPLKRKKIREKYATYSKIYTNLSW